MFDKIATGAKEAVTKGRDAFIGRKPINEINDINKLDNEFKSEMKGLMSIESISVIDYRDYQKKYCLADNIDITNLINDLEETFKKYNIDHKREDYEKLVTLRDNFIRNVTETKNKRKDELMEAKYGSKISGGEDGGKNPGISQNQEYKEVA